MLQIYYFSQDTIVRSIDRSDDNYISVRFRSSTHVEVFCNATWVDTLGNNDDVPLNQPSDDYLKEQCFLNKTFCKTASIRPLCIYYNNRGSIL